VRKKSGQGGDNGYPACASLDHAQQDRIDRIEHPNHIGLDQRAADFRDFEISSGRSSAHDPCIGKQKISRRGGVECHEPGFELSRTADVNERSRYDSAPFTAGHRDVVEPLLMIARRTMQACQRPLPAGRCNTPSRPSMAPTPMVAILADPYHVAIKSTATLEQWP